MWMQYWLPRACVTETDYYYTDTLYIYITVHSTILAISFEVRMYEAESAIYMFYLSVRCFFLLTIFLLLDSLIKLRSEFIPANSLFQVFYFVFLHISYEKLMITRLTYKQNFTYNLPKLKEKL